MMAFVAKINSRLILSVFFFEKMAEFFGIRKTFSMHIHKYLIRCTIGDFCLEMKSVFDLFLAVFSPKNCLIFRKYKTSNTILQYELASQSHELTS